MFLRLFRPSLEVSQNKIKKRTTTIQGRRSPRVRPQGLWLRTRLRHLRQIRKIGRLLLIHVYFKVLIKLLNRRMNKESCNDNIQLAWSSVTQNHHLSLKISLTSTSIHELTDWAMPSDGLHSGTWETLYNISHIPTNLLTYAHPQHCAHLVLPSLSLSLGLFALPFSSLPPPPPL